MKKLLMMGLLAGVLGAGLAACTGPIPAMQDPNQIPQVTMESNWVQNDVYATVLPVQRVGAGQMHVFVQLSNKTDHTLHLGYKYWFLDDHGAQLDNPSGWQDKTIPPRGTEQIDFISMNALAADFHVQLREQ